MTVVIDADYSLVQRCQAGESDAFALLVQRYQRQVYGIAYRLTTDRQEAEDLAQEAFLRAYRALATFRPDLPFGPWIARIVTNLTLDRLRKRRRETFTADDEQLEMADSGPGPEDVMIGSDDHGRLARAIAALSPDYRVPLLLHHVQGMALEDVVRVTGLPLTVVKNRLYRARKLLRDQLRAEAEPESSRGGERDEGLPVGATVGCVR